MISMNKSRNAGEPRCERDGETVEPQGARLDRAEIDPNGFDPMGLALAEAEAAARRGEVPVGAVVVDPSGRIVAKAGNQTRELSDPTAHAEILAIREACRTAGSERIGGFDIYVTLEPCPMCASAISFARIRRLYFGAADPKGGGVIHGPRVFAQSTCHHVPEIYDGIGSEAAASILRTFFSSRRA